MSLIWSNVDIEVPNNNKRFKKSRIKLISDACGVAEKGLLAIMGPSGSGKTTLLKALLGRIPNNSKTTGTILYNGEERNSNQWLRSVGFIDQDDSFYEILTAYEVIKTSAKLRSDYTPEEISNKINFIAEKLNIKHIMQNKMKSLSGGERKRVMIAIELVTDPKVILLDEPTSGLDNNTTHKLIQLLKLLAEEGRIIIFTIHQPDNITASFFDNIILLSRGKTIYAGEYQKCEIFLKDNGFGKLPEESFSNLAMRILDTGPDFDYESSSHDHLDEMANKIKNKYKSNSVSKIPKFSNDPSIYYSFDLNHFKILLFRRMKLYFFRIKTLIVILVYSLIVFFVMLFIQGMKSGVKKIDSQDENLPTNIKNLGLSLTNWSTEDVIITCLLPALAAMVGSTAGLAFNPESAQVKRELGVNTYSIITYYFVVLIYEYLFALIPFLVIVFYFLRLDFKIVESFHLMYILLIFITTIPFNMLFSNIINSKIATWFFTFISSGLSTIPYGSICFFVSLTMIVNKQEIGSGLKIFAFSLLFIPSQTISHFIRDKLNIKIDMKIKPYLSNQDNYSEESKLIDFNSIKKLITLRSKSLRKIAPSILFEKFSLFFYLIILYVFLISAGIFLFGSRLSHVKRYKLNN